VKTPRHDPVDHFRTSRPHAGETMTHGANAPGLAAASVAVVALVIGLFALATGHISVGCDAVILAVVLAAASGAWVLRTHRKVRAAERRWHAENFDQLAPPPSS
jgi:multisubunit Na+/H+ antiporter MnhB subunit